MGRHPLTGPGCQLDTHVRPKRAKGRSLEEIIEAFPELQELGVLIDGTERPIRRPKEPTKQKEDDSGKKKRHTKKYLTITHPQTQYILATSEEAGSTHDKKMLDESHLTCQESLPIGADSGFQGLELGKAVVIASIPPVSIVSSPVGANTLINFRLLVIVAPVATFANSLISVLAVAAHT